MGGMVMTQQAPAMSQHQEPQMYSFKGDSLQMGTTPPQHALEGEEISSSITPDGLSSCQTTTADEVAMLRLQQLRSNLQHAEETEDITGEVGAALASLQEISSSISMEDEQIPNQQLLQILQAATHAEREIMREVHFHDDSVN